MRKAITLLNRLLAILNVQMVTAGQVAMTSRIERNLREAVRRLENSHQRSAHVFSNYLRSRLSSHSSEDLRQTLEDSLRSEDPLAHWSAHESQKDDSPLGNFMKLYCSVCQKLNSQWAQDAFVWHVSNSMREGRYLEIGAADGLSNSNTLALERELGWTGTLVEPSPKAFASLKANRDSRNSFINAAGGPDLGQKYVKFVDIGELSCVSGRGSMDQHAAVRLAEGRQIEVPQQPFSRMILDAGPLDYLSLDVEGGELDLLQWIDWSRTPPPRILTVEHNWQSATRAQIRTFMSSKGYALFLEGTDWLTRGDDWFVHVASVSTNPSTGYTEVATH